jgi:non-ribosomal peptide synthetase component F
MIASAYLDQASSAQAAFIEPPDWAGKLAKDPRMPTRFFKMGDLVQYQDDGSMLYHGRKGSQIRLR